MTDLRRYRTMIYDSARWEGFPFRDGDIVISTPPKCGTTWTQMICALLVFDATEFDRPLGDISPWLDMQLRPRDEVVAALEAQQHRRFIKTHTPLDGLPFDDRVTYICVARDPRDVFVSWEHHWSNLDMATVARQRGAAVGNDDLSDLQGQQGDRPVDPRELVEAFLAGTHENVMSLPRLVHHVATFWERRELPQIELLHYTDLQADLPGQMGRLAAALGIQLPAARVEQLAAAATFTQMRQRAQVLAPNAARGIWRDATDFFHRGTTGQWREVFEGELLRRYDQRLRELAGPELASWLHTGWLARSPVG